PKLSKKYTEFKDLVKDTVILAEYEYYEYKGKNEFKTANEDSDKFNAVFRALYDVENKPTQVSYYRKEERNDSFFFVAPKTGSYLFEITNEGDKNLCMRINIYEGAKGEHRILSSADAQVRDVRNRVRNALTYANKISETHVSDNLEKDEFLSSLKTMKIVIVISVLLKFAVVLITHFVFGKRMKKFWAQKKIINE
ncbi:hypothetical protein H311_01610, partial [Anncaliia algerae PRA109]